jgi:uncharacterized protein
VHVTRLARYPVKSFQGETLDASDVSASGLDSDRRWAVWDPGANKAVSAKREGRLLEASAAVQDGAVVVTLPDGTTAEAGDPQLDKAIAAWLDRDVHLKRADDSPAAYEMNLDNTDPDSALVDIPCPPGTFLDFGAVHLMTSASLHAVGGFSVERFRPSVLIESDEAGYPEDEWIGRTVSIGDVLLQPFMPTIRCVMTTRPQPAHGLARDLEVVKAVNKEHSSNLGVYAIVVQPGRFEVGQAVTVD